MARTIRTYGQPRRLGGTTGDRFAVAGLLALGLVAASGIVVVRRLATDEALSEARQLTAISARVVERRVNDGLLTGDAESLAAVASEVFPSVLHDPIVRVKIWAADGTIMYSDKSRPDRLAVHAR